jgi:hypothetical protein
MHGLNGQQVSVLRPDGLPSLCASWPPTVHPDHLGLAHWLCAQWQVPLWISATDYQTAKNLIAASTATHDGQQSDRFFQIPVEKIQDEAVLAALKDRTLQFGHMVPALPPAVCAAV